MTKSRHSTKGRRVSVCPRLPPPGRSWWESCAIAASPAPLRSHNPRAHRTISILTGNVNGFQETVSSITRIVQLSIDLRTRPPIALFHFEKQLN